MPSVKTTLLVLLAIVAAGFVAFLLRHAKTAPGKGNRVRPTAYELFTGFVTDFLDTLGIGSFATTTAMYRARRAVADELIPGTLNVGHTLPTIVQAFLYIDVIQVDPLTLVAMIVAAVAGSLLGAPIVSRLPRRHVQIGLGWALLVLCTVLVIRQFGDPKGGEALGLEGSTFVVGLAANFVLGALMTIGVGLYAPCLLLVSLLGMNPKTGFPIMMGSCAFLMPLASATFVRAGRYAPGATIGLALAGVPAVFIAANVVWELDLKAVKWLVAVVVVYTAVTLLRAARAERIAAAASVTATPPPPRS
ncbi:MAG TPA: sulfite exporter TauE/SafE family protein [Planctomycetota bacterium]|nr:sulfite exporter TauE/SafE family protein [Planctomycetota bacterium]